MTSTLGEYTTKGLRLQRDQSSMLNLKSMDKRGTLMALQRPGGWEAACALRAALNDEWLNIATLVYPALEGQR